MHRGVVALLICGAIMAQPSGIASIQWAIQESFDFAGSKAASIVFELSEPAAIDVAFDQRYHGQVDDQHAIFFHLEHEGNRIDDREAQVIDYSSAVGMAEVAVGGRDGRIAVLDSLEGVPGIGGSGVTSNQLQPGLWRGVMFGDALSGTNDTHFEFKTSDSNATVSWEFGPTIYQLFGTQHGHAAYYRSWLGSPVAGSTAGAAVADGQSSWSVSKSLWGFSAYVVSKQGIDMHNDSWLLPSGQREPADNVTFRGADSGTYALTLRETSAGRWPGELTFLGADLPR